MIRCHPIFGRFALPFGFLPPSPLCTQLAAGPCPSVQSTITNSVYGNVTGSTGGLDYLPSPLQSSAFSPPGPFRPWPVQYGACMTLIRTPPRSLGIPDTTTHRTWPSPQSTLGQNVLGDNDAQTNRNSPSSAEEHVDSADLRDLEQFAANFKSRRIKLGFTQTNVGK